MKIEPSTGLSMNAGVLRRLARLAHDRIHTPTDRDVQNDMDGVVAVVFAAVSLEAFINELMELAATAPPSDPPQVHAFALRLRTVEASRGTTSWKFAVAGEVFRGKPYDTNAGPFQRFKLLFALRDAIVHLKSECLEFDGEGRLIESSHEKVLKRLRSQKILAEYDPSAYVGTSPSWISLLSTRAVARWACNVASDVVMAVLDSIPDSAFRRKADFSYRANFRRVGTQPNRSPDSKRPI
jgi:hypothetical protein